MSTLTPVRTVDDFQSWLTSSAPGDQFIYHQGDLFADRQLFVMDVPEGYTPMSADERFSLGRLADAAYRAAKMDQVLLVQKRLGPSSWAYMAIRRRPPKKRPKPTLSVVRDAPRRYSPTLRLITSPADLERVLS